MTLVPTLDCICPTVSADAYVKRPDEHSVIILSYVIQSQAPQRKQAMTNPVLISFIIVTQAIDTT